MSDDAVKHTLTKPIKDLNGNPINEITVRSPTMKEFRKHGLPVNKDNQVDFDKAGKMLEALTGIQLPILDALSSKDSMKLVKILSEFIGEATEDDAKNSE